MQIFNLITRSIEKRMLQKMRMIMKFSFILVFFGTVCLWANTGHAQNTRVNLHLEKASLVDVFREIEKQSEYRFFYNNAVVNAEQKIDLSATNESIADLLKGLFQGTNIHYRIVENYIVITHKGDGMDELLLKAAVLQGIAITGTVTDDFGESMPGVNVVVKGTTTGVITDADGRYSINVPGADAVLVFSFVGFATQEFLVGDQRSINVTLSETTREIEEVVVIGYGTQKRVNLTGAVSSVDMSRMADSRPITNLSAGLAGLAAGVTITQGGGGRPGYDGAIIRVRGQGSLNNSDPLVVLDGVAGVDINDINPQDVESMSVLKDAASSSIYGSRAANGVILITTKQGREGTAKINYSGTVTAQKLAHKINLVSNYADYMELMNEGYRNSGQAQPFSQGKIDEWRAAGNSDPVKYPNTDWQDEFFQRGWMQDHTLSVTGGKEKIRYFVSGNYLHNPGIVEYSTYNRFSARINLDVDVKPWFKIGLNSYGYRGTEDIGLENYGTIFTMAIRATPGICMRAPDGRYGGLNNPEDDMGSQSLLRQLHERKGDRTRNKYFSRFYGQLNPLPGLSIEGSYTYDFTNYHLHQMPVFLPAWNFYDNTIQNSYSGRTSVSINDNKWEKNYLDGIIRYEKDFGKLNMKAMAGASQESFNYQWFSATKYDLTSGDLTEMSAATMDADASGSYTNWAMRSFFGRLNLNWADKYLLEANLRMDYSSRFAPGKTRRGVFPSFSAGWRINEEDFMRDISWMSSLKLRASYGALGNNAMGGNSNNDGNYSYQSFYSNRNYVLNNNTVQVGFAQAALSNSLLTWETTYVSNVGVDFGLLKFKLNGSVDFFVKNTKDILIDLPAPDVRGLASVPRQNVGKVRNTGIEITLSWNDKIGEVGYFVTGNYTYVKNKLTKFKGEESTINADRTMLLEGKPINVLYMMKVDRLVQTDADLAVVQAMVDKNPNAFSSYTRPVKGDYLYQDTDGDGVLTPDDRVIIGNGPNPTSVYSGHFGVNWKGFDFSCLLQGVNDVKSYMAYWSSSAYYPNVRSGCIMNKDIMDGRWYEGRTDATFPRLLDYNDSRNRVESDKWVGDRSYLRVKNIQLGYMVPKTVSQKFYVENLRVYVSIDNAWLFTKYPGLDPESYNVEMATYPTVRMTSIGVNLTF